MTTRFTLRDHHQFVLDHGEPLAWRRGLKCPCGVSMDPQRVRPTCKVCQGLGFRYESPTRITGLITGMQHQKALLQAGVAMAGDLLLGLSPFDRTPLADWDAIRFLARPAGTAYDGDVRTRDADDPVDYLAYDAVKVHRCFSIDPATQQITEYVEGTDFTVSGREITWLPAVGGGVKGPPPRQKYSIKYTATFDWLVFVTPMERYDQKDFIGTRALLRKRHVATAPTVVPF